MILTPLVNAAQEMNRALERVSRYSVLRVAQDAGAFAIGTLLAWRTGLGPAAPFAGLASVLAVLAVIEGSRLWRESRGGHFEQARVRPYLAYGVPIAVALGLNIALDAGDRFLIALFLGPEAVGIYAAGYGIADKSVGLLCAWAAAAGAPMMMAAWEREGPEAVREVSALLPGIDAPLGSSVVREGCISIQVVVGHVEGHGQMGTEATDALKLKARQLHDHEPAGLRCR